MNERDDRFGMIPRPFFDALARGEVTGRQFHLGCYLVCAVDWRTAHVALTLRALADGADYTFKDDTLLRDLKALRPGWIEFTIGQGQRRPYVFRLTGLARGGDAPPPQHFRTEHPSGAEVTSALRKSDDLANIEPEPVPAVVEPPDCGGPLEEKRRDQPREDHDPNPSSEEDNAVGTTTTTRPESTELLIAAGQEQRDRAETSFNAIDLVPADVRRLLEARDPGFDLTRDLLRPLQPASEGVAA